MARQQRNERPTDAPRERERDEQESTEQRVEVQEA